MYLADTDTDCLDYNNLHFGVNPSGFGNVAQSPKPTVGSHKMSHTHVDEFEFTEILAVDEFGDWVICNRGGAFITAQEVFTRAPFHTYQCKFSGDDTIYTSHGNPGDHGPIFWDINASNQWMWHFSAPCRRGSVQGKSTSDGENKWWWYGRQSDQVRQLPRNIFL